MAVTAHASGTQTATISTEHTLDDIAVSGTYVFEVDTINMAAGDTLELRIYVMVLAGGTRRVAYKITYSNAQDADDLIKISVPVSNELTDSGAVRCTLKQIAGTGRSFPWKVLKHA